jgi:hypothetical protein
MNKRSLLRLLAFAMAFAVILNAAFAQGTAFTYQGRLDIAGTPANGTNDLTFTLYDAASAGATVGTSNTVNDLVITNGLFTVTLDFGAGVFNGAARWLQIAARPGVSTGAYTNLAPRQPITPTPYAIYAGGAAAAGLSGTLPAGALSGAYSGSVNFSNAANSFAGNGRGLTNLSTTNLVGTVADARLSANVALLDRATQIFTGGTNSFSGNVGIGTAGPTAALQVRTKPLSSGLFTGEANAAALFKSASHNGGNVVAPPESVLVLGRDGVAGQSFANYARFDLSRYEDFSSDSRSQLDFRLSHGRLDAIGSAETNNTPTIMSLRSSGNVGIGTANPNAKLDVFGTNGTSIRVTGPGGNGATVALDLATFDAGATNGPSTRIVATDANFSGHLEFQTKLPGAATNAMASRLFIRNDGNVGVGKTNPATALDVNGTATATTFVGSFTGNANGLTNLSATSLVGNVADARLSANVALLDRAMQTFTGGTNSFSGKVGIGTTSPDVKLEVAGPSGTSIRVTGPGGGGTTVALDLATYDVGTNSPTARIVATDANYSGHLDLQTKVPGAATNAMVSRLFIQNDGNVGIGTTTPAFGLHVQDSGSQTGRIHVGGTSADGARKIISFGDGDYVYIGENGFDDRMEIAASYYYFNGGNVGIGTATPSQKLVVSGGGTELQVIPGYLNGSPDTNAVTLEIPGGKKLGVWDDLVVAGEVTCTAVNITSDRNAKEQFKPVSPRDVLAKVAALPITEWQYKTQGDARHIGPMAQDFHAAFGTGRDDRHITSVDADGVALAAIQGLNEMVKEREVELSRLKSENQSLAERLAAIESALGLRGESKR